MNRWMAAIKWTEKRRFVEDIPNVSDKSDTSNVSSMPTPYAVTDSCESALNNIKDFISKYVNMTPGQGTVVALWVVHTHLIHLFNCTPYLAVTSATKRSGKTRLLEVVELLVNDPLRTANITEAALFRAMSERTRTLLLDEVDTVFGDGKSRELLRAILNASYRRGSPVYRTRGKTVEGFDVFSPKMIAGIGDLPDTVEDRSIPIRLVRSTPPQRFRYSDVAEEAELLKTSLDAFKDERLMKDIYELKPELPTHLHDRQQDSWESLFQIGIVTGWKDQVYEAANELYEEGNPWEKKGGETHGG